MKLTNEMLLGTAKWAGICSKDKHTKVGCLIMRNEQVLSVAWNEFPRGVKDTEERRERPLKYKYTEHAERNAIYAAARAGEALRDATMYLPYYPCSDCARAIICSGIRELVCHRPDFECPTWGQEFRIAGEMLHEAEVIVTFEEKK